jgi:hypothetical protein
MRAAGGLPLLWAIVLVASCGLAGRSLPAVHAQPPEPWTDPQMLSSGLLDGSGQPLWSAFPALVADPWGGVQAFWTMLPRQQDASQDGTLFWSHWDGSTWSPPIDVQYAQRRPMWLPMAALDETGRLHLAWMVGAQGSVWYSSALVGQAGSARAWSTPQQISDLISTGFGLATDSLGQAHIVFCTGGEDDRCYYSTSSDGNAWTSAAAIYNPCDDCSARVAVDGRGRIHTVFGSQSTGGKALHYSRSDDAGRTWLPAQEFDRVDDRFDENYGPSWGTVVTLGQDQVHVIWDGAPAGQRWHRWSSDGGNTWSEPQQISADHRGLTLPVAAAFDSAGTLHLVSMGWRDTTGLPSGAFHLTWQNGRWSQPQLIGSRSDWDAEYCALAITGGNRLVAAWTDKQGPKESYQVWASTLKVDAPSIPPIAYTPAATLTPTGQPRGAAPTASSTPGSEGATPPAFPATALSSAGLGAQPAQSAWVPIVLGALPPLILVLLILIVRRNRQRQGG